MDNGNDSCFPPLKGFLKICAASEVCTSPSDGNGEPCFISNSVCSPLVPGSGEMICEIYTISLGVGKGWMHRGMTQIEEVLGKFLAWNGITVTGIL